MGWLKEMFGTDKPIIGLLHLKALPGDPFYKSSDTMESLITQAKADLIALQTGGVDGVLITNEFSMPYEKKVSSVTIAAMAYVIGALHGMFTVPYGVEVIYDSDASIEICAATDARFTRCVFTGAYVGDLGLIDRDIAKTLRLRRALDMNELKMFYFVNSEGEVYLNDRDEAEITKTMIFNCRPECFVVAGGMAGISPKSTLLSKVKAAAKDIPVFCGTGCRVDTIEDILKIADGAFVGTTFKKDEKFEERIDLERVLTFMEKAKQYQEVK